MRDIKFRFWHIKEQKMIDWVWITQNAWNSYRGDTPISLLFDFLTVKKDQVVTEQFTGLKDKNGAEIYEGDLLKTFGMIYQVVFSDGAFYMKLRAAHHRLSRVFIIQEEIEIMGNIHENPELLKQ